ncbi:hypothetical protein V8G54_014231, partial [Vigna mungo]
SNLIVISNITNLSIDGSGGSIDGYGSTWWNCQSCKGPTILRLKFCNDLTVSNLTITNSPKAHIRINIFENATFSNISIRSPSDSPNTDGFDIYTSKNILIQNSTIQCGDDCIAINGGSYNISATRIACGPSHNCTFTNTENGARIKTVPGGSGYARKITFENITLIDTDNPIIIDQYYGSYGK